jgi:uncharacterized membrane protein YdjX (TVP38/TMEM64 family)
MDLGLINSLPLYELGPMIAVVDSELLVAGFFFVATAALIALCVPGVLMPMALSSGAILGGWGAAAAVALGAVAGSQLFFLSARCFAGDRLRARLGNRLETFERRFAEHGILYVIGLRLIGAPHFLVTAGSALMPIRSSSFAAATLLGFLPAIAIASATGSAI